jgi:hypothetical protein
VEDLTKSTTNTTPLAKATLSGTAAIAPYLVIGTSMCDISTGASYFGASLSIAGSDLLPVMQSGVANAASDMAFCTTWLDNVVSAGARAWGQNIVSQDASLAGMYEARTIALKLRPG